MDGSDTGSDKKPVISVIVQNWPGDRSAYFLVIRSDIGSDKKLPVIDFSLFVGNRPISTKTCPDRLHSRSGQVLVMFQFDTGFDNGFRNFFGFSLKSTW